jgi:hypothetical protein
MVNTLRILYVFTTYYSFCLNDDVVMISMHAMHKQGAETSSIIAIYIAMIKALRHLDPSDALLEVTTLIILHYTVV